MIEGFSIRNYLRELRSPFCPGCGDLIVRNCFLRAVHELGYQNLDKFVFCSGIGCAAWIPSPYFEADAIHAAHGRSIPVATGVKVVRPDLNVVVFGGDGDIVGIGLSHLIHAARRNLDITVIMVNNMIYGMTGGQVAPTTPLKVRTTTTPYGNEGQPLDSIRLVIAAGASYAARWTTYHVQELKKAIKEALKMRGFAFIEAVSQCPTAFGKKAGLEKATDILEWFKENSIKLPESRQIGEEKLREKIVVGEFIQRRFPTLTDTLGRIQRSAEEVGEIL